MTAPDTARSAAPEDVSPSPPTSPLPVAVFARPPRPGSVKTRLARSVGEAQAARLYAACLEDTLARCLALAAVTTTLWVAGDPDDPALLAVPSARRVPRLAQPSGDLGARMAAALAYGITTAGRAAVLGSDAPTFPAALLDAAGRALSHGADLVLGPSSDGGYVFIGARGRVPPVFDRVRWSSPSTLADTLARARAAALRIAALPPWYDVDDADGLRLLRTHLLLAPGSAPATARALASGPRDLKA